MEQDNTGASFDGEYTSEELENMLRQLPSGALPQTEANLKARLAGVLKEELDRAVERDERLEKEAKEALTGSKTVDLVMYIGGERKIVGKATVLEGVIFSKLNDDKSVGDQAARAIMEGMIDAITVRFSMRPAYPAGEINAEAMSSFWNRDQHPILPYEEMDDSLRIRSALPPEMPFPFQDPPRKYPDMTQFLEEADPEVSMKFRGEFPPIEDQIEKDLFGNKFLHGPK